MLPSLLGPGTNRLYLVLLSFFKTCCNVVGSLLLFCYFFCAFIFLKFSVNLFWVCHTSMSGMSSAHMGIKVCGYWCHVNGERAEANLDVLISKCLWLLNRYADKIWNLGCRKKSQRWYTGFLWLSHHSHGWYLCSRRPAEMERQFMGV